MVLHVSGVSQWSVWLKSPLRFIEVWTACEKCPKHFTMCCTFEISELHCFILCSSLCWVTGSLTLTSALCWKSYSSWETHPYLAKPDFKKHFEILVSYFSPWTPDQTVEPEDPDVNEFRVFHEAPKLRDYTKYKAGLSSSKSFLCDDDSFDHILSVCMIRSAHTSTCISHWTIKSDSHISTLWQGKSSLLPDDKLSPGDTRYCSCTIISDWCAEKVKDKQHSHTCH